MMAGTKGTQPGRSRWTTRASHALVPGVLSLLLSACASFRDVPTPAPPPPDVETPAPDGPPSVYIIHGDADYLYHDARGNRLYANEEALRQAREAARGAVHGHVFIFHQRTGMMRKLWGSQGGLFEYYRAGRLVERASYVRDGSGFAGEAKLLRRLKAEGTLLNASPESAALLAYFGHEIKPGMKRADGEKDKALLGGGEDVDGGAGAGLEGQLTIPQFKDGLAKLAEVLGSPQDAANDTTPDATSAAKPYGVVVLSTCYGGTPHMMRALAPLADFAVASPAYLHLSYLETRPLARARFIGATPGQRREEAGLLADSVARASFDRLRWQTMTEVTVAVYDLDETVPPTSAAIASTGASGTSGKLGWRDCAADETTLLGEESARGVTLHYQPPRFGAGKNTAARSAWQCPL